MNAIRSGLLLLLFCFVLGTVHSQQAAMPAENGMITRPRNYTSFSKVFSNLSEEAKLANARYAQHPELGLLFADAPATDVYEVIGERTEKSKKFIKTGSNGREIMFQTSSDAMHYRDEKGEWRTITSKLRTSKPGIYTAPDQPVPVSIDANQGSVRLGSGNAEIVFNRNLQFVYATPDGAERILGNASWTHHTAGDDGVYVTDIWPGIDMEVYVARGAVKTNFYITAPMPLYAGGRLLIRDHINSGNGRNLYAPTLSDHKGIVEVRDSTGDAVYLISPATAFEQRLPEHTTQVIGYNIHQNTLDIVVPGDLLNREAAAYPIVIDPLVSTPTASTVGGSSYSPANTVSCNYVNAAIVPPNVTVTDVRWSFNYVTGGGAQLLNGKVDFTLGTCRSPAGAGFFWFCNLASAGTCTGTNVSIFPDIATCILPPQCASYAMNLNMRFYQNFATTPPCATTYITAGTPLTITVFGRTVETGPVSSVGGLTSICLGQSVTLSTVSNFGVPPYNYVWTPGTVSGNPATLTPLSSTPYTVTVTDACGQTATAAQTIVVAPITPITGSSIVCTGGNTTLLNITGPGTWSSTNGLVAVIGPTSGVVSGLSPGTTIISYTTPLGCYATKVVTVTPMPGSIGGALTLCVGGSTTLTNPMPGGTWSSGALGVAVVGAGTGVVSGIAAGTAEITYATSPGCTATAIATVYPNPAITAVSYTNPTTCGATDGTITLSGLTPGATYSISYMAGTTPVAIPIVADASGQILITGLSAGIYSSLTATAHTGCSGAWHTSVTLIDMGTPPIPVASSNAPICEGGTLTLSATGAAGVLYTWAGPGGFSSTLQNPVIDPASAAAAGEYSVTATLLGCVTLPGTTTVTINPLPHIWGLQFTNPITCNGSEGSLTLEGLVPGTSYNVGYMHNGTPGFVSVTADGLGNVIVYGLPSGTYANIFVSALSCVSNLVGPITLTDPLAPPPPAISSNAPICTGLTLMLFGTDDKPGGTYSWTGPNGFTANLQNPVIPYVTIGAEGVYTLSYTRFNCTSSTTSEIKLQPEIKLTDVTATSYLFPFGDSVQLHASGATFYIWTPHNGTLSDHYIYNPFAKPKDSITVYTVHGMNEWGCHDSANITLKVIFEEDEYIPTAFTPNGDGKNDIFRIGKMRYKKLVDFTIYNRWGQEVYHNPYDINGGWDGTAFGKPMDMGVYYYSIIIETASGKLKYYKGDVTLIR